MIYQRELFDRALALLTLLVLLLVTGGCQILEPNPASLLADPNDATPQKPAAAPANAQTYYVEFRPDQKKPILIAMPLNDVTYMQQALDQTKALKKFRRVKIELYRQLPQGGGHKIPVQYDRGKRQIDPETDYAIHPHDRIVVTEDTSTVIDDMLESLGAPSKTLGAK